MEIPNYHKMANVSGSPNNNDIYTTQPMSAVSRPASVIVVNAGKTSLSLESQRMMCPHCNVTMMTKIEYRAVFRTHVIAAVLCMTGFCILAPLPYFFKGCKRVDHYCSNCNQFIGKAN